MKKIILFILLCALKTQAQENRTVSEDFTSNGQFLMKAATDLASVSEIGNKATVTFVAGNSILLTDGFYATTGAGFKGYIDTDEVATKSGFKAKMQLTATPNPSSDVVNINLKNDQITRVVLIAMDGKTVLNEQLGNLDSYLLEVNQFPKGVYLLTVETKSGNTNTDKIIIQ